MSVCHTKAPPVGGDLAEIWRTSDYRGRVVVLTTEGRAHIVHRRSTMAARLAEVRLAIERPTLVTQDATYPRRECHYRQTSDGQGLIKVVVKYGPIPPQGTWLGEVVTAYPVDNPKRKEAPLWP